MKYQLTLTEHQLGVIDAALQDLPFRVAQPLIAALNRQLEEQKECNPEGHSDDRPSDPA